MKRTFRTIGEYEIKTYKNVGSVYNDNNSIFRLSGFNNLIVLKEGFKPIKRKGGYIDIVKEL